MSLRKADRPVLGRLWGARRAVRVRATVLATLVVALSLAVGGLLLVVLVHRSLVGSVDAAGSARARDVAALAAAGRLQATVASTGEESSVVQVVDPGGRVVAASPNILGEPALLPAAPTTRRRQVSTRSGLPIADPGQSFRVTAEPVALRSGRGWVYVATSLGQVDLTTTRLAALLLLGLPVLLLVVATAIWRAVGRALRPVEQIRASAAAIGGAQLDARVPTPDSGDEIARLAQTMNAMLARIQDATVRQREFVGDASHELRSPLAALQTELDVALAYPDGPDPAAVLLRLSLQTERMSNLLNDLLYLARADEGAPQARHGPVDLDELLLAEAGRLRTDGVTVTVVGPDAVRIQGSHGDLTRLLRNLGDNAAAHARTSVTLSLSIQDEQAVLSVADDGPGIPTADRERIFQRFARLDTARARTNTGGGAGLGLAICRQIVQRHDGTITVVDSSHGSRFVVLLPLTTSAGERTLPRPRTTR
jgi:signal transduction histidine kinase